MLRLIVLLWSSLSSWRPCGRFSPTHCPDPTSGTKYLFLYVLGGLRRGSPRHSSPSPLPTKTAVLCWDPASFITFWKLPLGRKLGAFLACTACCPVTANRSSVHRVQVSGCSWHAQVPSHRLLHRWKKRLSRGA